MYDSDADTPDLSRHDFLGSVSCTVAEVVTARGRSLTRPLVHEKKSGNRGNLTIRWQETKDTSMVLELALSARNLDSVGMLPCDR